MRVLIIICLLFSACSTPQGKLQKLLKKYPELVTTKHDTIVIIDTISSIQKDTIFNNVFSKDTITIVQDRLSIKYVNDGKTVYLKGRCDTIYRMIKVPITTQMVTPVPEDSFIEKLTFYGFWIFLVLLIAVIIALYLVHKS